MFFYTLTNQFQKVSYRFFENTLSNFIILICAVIKVACFYRRGARRWYQLKRKLKRIKGKRPRVPIESGPQQIYSNDEKNDSNNVCSISLFF